MKKQTIEIDYMETVFAAYSNTNLTDGNGWEYPLAVCKTKATANRMGKGRYVQGTDCDVREVEVFRFNRVLYGPIYLHLPTTEDDRKQAEIDKKNEAERKKQAAIEKAKSLGLSDEDLEALKG